MTLRVKGWSCPQLFLEDDTEGTMKICECHRGALPGWVEGVCGRWRGRLNAAWFGESLLALGRAESCLSSLPALGPSGTSDPSLISEAGQLLRVKRLSVSKVLAGGARSPLTSTLGLSQAPQAVVVSRPLCCHLGQCSQAKDSQNAVGQRLPPPLQINPALGSIYHHGSHKVNSE